MKRPLTAPARWPSEHRIGGSTVTSCAQLVSQAVAYMTRTKPQKTVGRPGRRWCRYSLRALLLLVLLVSIGMSLFATRMRRATRQRDAVAAIEKSGGWVYYYHQFDPPDYSCFSFPRPPPPGPLWLRNLLGDDFFTSVVEAYVESDTDLKYLKQLDQLKRLGCAPEVTEAGLAHLKELRQLRHLDLSERRVTGATFEHIVALAELEELHLGLTDTGDAELERLETMTRLRWLGLGGTKITDAGLRHLEGLTRLEHLTLNQTQIGDAGVEHLKGLKQLKELGLGQTRVSDASLEHLTGFQHLVRLELQRTKVSAEGVRKVKRALPRCDVFSSMPGPPFDPFVTR